MSKKAIHSEAAPTALGPYSQAIRTGDLLWGSGQIPLDPKTMQLVEGGIKAETHQVMRNIEAVLQAAGASFQSVVRCTIYLTDLGDFGKVNEIYGSYFEVPAPARVTVQVAALPKGAQVEIDFIAKL